MQTLNHIEKVIQWQRTWWRPWFFLFPSDGGGNFQRVFRNPDGRWTRLYAFYGGVFGMLLS